MNQTDKELRKIVKELEIYEPETLWQKITGYFKRQIEQLKKNF